MDLLNSKISSLEEENNFLLNDNQNQKNEINQLKDDIDDYLIKEKLHNDECLQTDKKYNELAKSYKNQEKEYNEALSKLNALNNNMRAELELIKTKYEKKIQGLMINNNELNARVKNLMNSLITLKDYTLNIERNTNNNNSNYMNNSNIF